MSRARGVLTICTGVFVGKIMKRQQRPRKSLIGNLLKQRAHAKAQFSFKFCPEDNWAILFIMRIGHYKTNSFLFFFSFQAWSILSWENQTGKRFHSLAGGPDPNHFLHFWFLTWLVNLLLVQASNQDSICPRSLHFIPPKSFITKGLFWLQTLASSPQKMVYLYLWASLAI